MAWVKCSITGAPEESCAHCHPNRYLPAIKTRGRWQVQAERKSLDTADQRQGKKVRSNQDEERRQDTKLESLIRNDLVSLRMKLARDRKHPPSIFSNLALDELVIAKPTTLEALGNIESLTNTQIAGFGKDIMGVISARLEVGNA